VEVAPEPYGDAFAPAGAAMLPLEARRLGRHRPDRGAPAVGLLASALSKIVTARWGLGPAWRPADQHGRRRLRDSALRVQRIADLPPAPVDYYKRNEDLSPTHRSPYSSCPGRMAGTSTLRTSRSTRPLRTALDRIPTSGFDEKFEPREGIEPDVRLAEHRRGARLASCPGWISPYRRLGS